MELTFRCTILPFFSPIMSHAVNAGIFIKPLSSITWEFQLHRFFMNSWDFSGYWHDKIHVSMLQNSWNSITKKELGKKNIQIKDHLLLPLSWSSCLCTFEQFPGKEPFFSGTVSQESPGTKWFSQMIKHCLSNPSDYLHIPSTSSLKMQLIHIKRDVKGLL